MYVIGFLSYFPKELVNKGAIVGQCNRYDETPLDKAPPFLKNLLRGKAERFLTIFRPMVNIERSFIYQSVVKFSQEICEYTAR